MILGKMNFRELDQKWIAFCNKNDIKKICKKFKIAFEDGILLGYGYINHEKGLKIKIAGFVSKENDIYSIDQELIFKKSSIVFSKKLKYKVDKVDNSIVDKIEHCDQLMIHFESYYQKKAIVESRKIAEIDEFRHETFIDDVELTLNTGKNSEYLWARIEDCSINDKDFVCSLLENSEYNKKYKVNTLVLAKVLDNKKKKSFVIDYIVDIVKKEKQD